MVLSGVQFVGLSRGKGLLQVGWKDGLVVGARDGSKFWIKLIDIFTLIFP